MSNIPEILRSAFETRRATGAMKTAYSCAWYGADRELAEYGKVPLNQLAPHRLRVRSLATRYWNMQGPENLGEPVVGATYDDKLFGPYGISVIYKDPDNWLTRFALPDRGPRNYADVAVLGGRLVSATFAIPPRSNTPMQERDLLSLAEELAPGISDPLNV